MLNVIYTAFNHDFFSEISAAYEAIKNDGNASDQEVLTKVVPCALKIFGAIALLTCVPRVVTVSWRPIFTMLSVALHFFMALDCLKVANNLNKNSSSGVLFPHLRTAVHNNETNSQITQEINDAVVGTYILYPLFTLAMRVRYWACDIFKSKPAGTGGAE